MTLVERRRARAERRAFTLIELLVTVAMIGVLAALALVGYRRFIHSAQSAEAKSVIHMIRGGEEAFKAEYMVYMDCSNGTLSLGNYYPNPTPNDARMNWIQPGNARYATAPAPCAAGMCGGFAALNVATDAPVRFGYAVVAGVGSPVIAPTAFSTPPTMPALANGVPWYTIQAVNDHDGNGKYAVFASASTSTEILSENEEE